MTEALRSPRFWLVTLAALLVWALTFSLGQWQLRRAAQKQSLQAAIASQASQSILDNRALDAFGDGSAAVHRQATLKGVWSAQHIVFLDNRSMNQKTGFIVVAPLVLDGTSQVILVQRGWVQRDFTERARLPNVSTPVGPVTVRGRIAPPPSKLYEFNATESGRIRQNMDLSSFSKEIRMPLLGVSLIQTGPANEGLLRDWPPPDFGVQKHYGYAFQWFALCALVTGLYFWFQVFNPLRNRRRTSSCKSTGPHST